MGIGTIARAELYSNIGYPSRYSWLQAIFQTVEVFLSNLSLSRNRPQIYAQRVRIPALCGPGVITRSLRSDRGRTRRKLELDRLVDSSLGRTDKKNEEERQGF